MPWDISADGESLASLRFSPAYGWACLAYSLLRASVQGHEEAAELCRTNYATIAEQRHNDRSWIFTLLEAQPIIQRFAHSNIQHLPSWLRSCITSWHGESTARCPANELARVSQYIPGQLKEADAHGRTSERTQSPLTPPVSRPI